MSFNRWARESNPGCLSDQLRKRRRYSFGHGGPQRADVFGCAVPCANGKRIKWKVNGATAPHTTCDKLVSLTAVEGSASYSKDCHKTKQTKRKIAYKESVKTVRL